MPLGLWHDRIIRPWQRPRRSIFTRLRLEALEERALLSVRVTQNFDGLSFFDTNCNCYPPDTIMAVGKTSVVELVNTAIVIKDKSGNVLIQPQELSDFFSSIFTSGDNMFDPYILYDDQADRFYVGVGEANSDFSLADIDLAVSNSGSPENDGWTVLNKITSVEEGGNDFADFPKMGWNHDALIVSFNQFSTSSGAFDHNLIVAFDKSAIINGDSLVQNSNYFQTVVDTQSDHRIMIPARMHGSKSGDPEYFVQTDDEATTVNVVAMGKILSQSPTFTTTTITVNDYMDSPGIPELTSLIDDRMLSADWINNKLAAAGNVGLPTDSLNHARWYEFDTSGNSPTLVQQGDISPDGTNTSYPAIAVNSREDIGLTYLESSDSEFVSMMTTGRIASDPLNTLESSVLTKAGEGDMSDTRGGDYAAAEFDPVDSTFWAANEYGLEDGGIWGTQIANFLINHPPVVDLNGPGTGIAYSATFTEKGGPVAIVDSNQLTVADLDDPNLVSGTVTLTNILDGSAESLGFNTSGTSITGSYNANTGVLSLTGTDTLADYQKVLRTITYNNTSLNPNTTDRKVNFVVNDGDLNSNIAVSTVHVIALHDDPPVVDLNGSATGINYSATFTEEGGPVAVVDGNSLTVSAPDSTTLASATVTITNLKNPPAESLAVNTSGTTISASYDATTGVLSLTGTDTLADYQQVLRTITYNNTIENPNTTTRIITFAVSDGTLNNSPTAITTLTVIRVDDPPVVDLNGPATGVDYAATFNQCGGPVAVEDSNQLTVSDPDDTTLASATVMITNLLDGPAESLTADTSGTSINASYDPNSGVLSLTGTDTLANYQQVLRSVTYNNTALHPDPTNRSITFIVNDGQAVGAAATTLTVIPDQPPALDLNGPASGIDYSAVFEVGNGPVPIVDSTQLSVTDADDATLQSATVTITNLKDGSAAALAADTTGTAIQASYDPSSGVLSLTGTDTVANYQQVLRTVAYVDTAAFPERTSRIVTFVVNDGCLDSVTATSTVLVHAQLILDLNGPAAGIDYTATFTEELGPMAVEDSNQLTVTDTDSATAVSATVTITNLLNGNSESLTAETTGTLIAASYNSTTGVLSLTGTDTLANYQQVLRTVTYNSTSDPPDTTDRIITFVFNDGVVASSPATTTLTVIAVNDAPTLDPIADLTILSHSPTHTVNLTGITSGAPGEHQLLTITAVSDNPGLIPNPAVSYASPNTTGTLSFTPVANFTGTATITVTVQDNGGTANGGVDTTKRQFTVTVILNTPPVINNSDLTPNPGTVAEGSPATLSGKFTDVDVGQDHQVVIDWGDGTANTTLILLGGLSNFSTTHGFADVDPPGIPPDVYTVTVTVIDSSAGSDSAVTHFTVTNVAPTVKMSGSTGGAPGQPLGFSARISDPGVSDTFQISWNFGDGTTLPFQASTAAGALTPSHFYGKSGTYTVKATVRDDDGGIGTAQMKVTITSTTVVGIPGSPGQQELLVAGTPGDDQIFVRQIGPGQVSVSLNGNLLGPFGPINRMRIYGGAGNDRIQLDSHVTVPALLDGGPGNNILVGGAGDDVLIGGKGNNSLFGGGGSNLLISGRGAARMIGSDPNAKRTGTDGSILIAGQTIYDADPTALFQIVNEWASAHSYAERVAWLTNGVNGLPKLNATTVMLDHQAIDQLFASPSLDWLFFAPGRDQLVNHTLFQVPSLPVFQQRRMSHRH